MPINGNFGGNTVLSYWKSQPRDLMTIFCAGHVTKTTQMWPKIKEKWSKIVILVVYQLSYLLIISIMWT